MKIKHLTRQGNSFAVIIDRPLLDLADIDEQTPLQLTLDGRKIVLSPLSDEEIERRFAKASAEVQQQFRGMFKRLAKK